MRRATLLALLLFTLSGVSGLIYEITWIRLLSHLLGGTSFAISTVLASAVEDCALAKPVSEPGPVGTDFTVASHVGPFGSAITMPGVVVGSSA